MTPALNLAAGGLIGQGEAHLNVAEWVLVGAGPVVLALLWWRGVIGPGSLRREGDEFGRPRGFVWIAYALLLWVCMQVLGGMLLAVVQALPWTTSRSQEQALTQLVIYGTGIVIGQAVYRRLSGVRGCARVWRGVRWGAAGAVLLVPILAGISALTQWVQSLVSAAPPPVLAHETLTEIAAGNSARDPWVYGVMFMAVVAAPIFEELLYRGLLQTGLVRATGRRWAGVLLTSLLFVAPHMPVVPPEAWLVGLPTIFVLSLGLGVVYQRTGSLAAPIVMHALFNAMNVGLSLTV